MQTFIELALTVLEIIRGSLKPPPHGPLNGKIGLNRPGLNRVKDDW